MSNKKIPIDKIPEEWKVMPLEDVVEINKESRDPTKETTNDKFLYIDIESVEGETGVIKKAKEILGNDAPSRARRVVHQNDVIMSTVRPYLKAFALVPKEYNNQICSTGFAVLSCKNEIFPRYLLYTLFSKEVIEQCNKMMMGGQYPALNQSQVAKIEIPLPPLPEQRRIAEVLGTVDSAIQKVGGAIERTERLKRGLMQKLLTRGIGHERFKETKVGRVPEEWEVVRLGDKTVANLIMGQSPPSSTYNNEGIGVPFLQGNAEFTENYPKPILSCSQPTKLSEKNDILLSVRAPVGDVNIAPYKLCIGRGLAAIRPKSDRLEYLFLFYDLKFRNHKFESLSMGSTFKAIRKEEVEKFQIPLPPLPEQRRIAEILSTVDKKLELERRRKEKLERIKKGLMNELLTGRKRVNRTEIS